MSAGKEVSGKTFDVILKNGDRVPVFKEFIEMSETLTNMFQELGDMNEVSLENLNITTDSFKKMVDLCKFHYTRKPEEPKEYSYSVYDDKDIKKNDPETYKALQEIKELEEKPKPTPISDEELQILFGKTSGYSVDEEVPNFYDILNAANFLNIRIVEEEFGIVEEHRKGYVIDLISQIIANRLNETINMTRKDGIDAIAKILHLERDYEWGSEQDKEHLSKHGWIESI